MTRKPLAEQNKRGKVTAFIAACKSRQEFEPPVGRLIDRAHADPLHVKNNACQLIHQQMLGEAISKSALNDDISNFKAVPSSFAFYKFLHVLKHKCRLCLISAMEHTPNLWEHSNHVLALIFDALHGIQEDYHAHQVIWQPYL